MAATIATAIGRDRTRIKETHRLGSESAYVQAATWRTFVSGRVGRDGAGYVKVVRDGKTIYRFEFGPEAEDTDGGEAPAA